MPDLPLVPFENTPYSDPIFPGIPVPESDPQSEPKVCLTYNADWQPILTALASRLTRRDAWNGDDAQRALGVRKAHEFIAQIQAENCPEGIPADSCEDFHPENPFTQYYPNNPFTSPDYVPPGYDTPPWYTNPLVPLPGVIPTDAMVNFLSLPISGNITDLIAAGLPHCRIYCSGRGELELEFVKVLQGGYIMIIIDDNPLTVQFEDLNALSLSGISTVLDLLGIIVGGSLQDTEIVEIKFETLGTHHVDITFLPNVDGEVIIGFGGGIRRITFCSAALDGDMVYMPVSGVRINTSTCKWQAEYNGDGIWVDFADYWQPACVPPLAEQFDIRDLGTGQLQKSFDGGENWQNVSNAHYLHINADNDPLTGKLDISPPTDVTLLQLNRINTGTLEPLMRWNVGEANYEGGLSKLGRLVIGQTPSAATDAASIKVRNQNTTGAIGVYADMVGNAGLITGLIGQVLGAAAENNGVYARVGNASVNKAIVIESLNVANNNWALYSLARAKSYLGGRLGIGFGNTNPAAPIHAIEDPGSNSGVLDLFILGREYAAGAAVAGFGLATKFKGKSSTTNARDMALLKAVWEEPADATRKANVVLSAFDSAAEREVIRGGANGTHPTIAVLGQTPSPRVDVGVIDCLGNAGAKAALDALKTFGWISGTINLGEAPSGGTTVISTFPVPSPLPLLTSQDAAHLCNAANAIAVQLTLLVSWLATIIKSPLYDGTATFFLTEVNRDVELGSASLQSYLSIGNWADLAAANLWYIAREAWAAGSVDEDIITWGTSQETVNTVFSVLLDYEEFDQVTVDAIAEIYGQMISEYAPVFQDAMPIIPLEAWQRVYWIGLRDAGEDCQADWNVMMDFTSSPWDASVTLIHGDYVPPYQTTPTEALIIKLPFHITEAVISVYNEFSLPTNALAVKDLTTDITTFYTVNIGNDTKTWSGDSPEGIEITIVRSGSDPDPARESQIRTIDLYGIGVVPHE